MDVERECVLDVFPGHVLVAPAALVGSLEAVDEVALALQFLTGERAQLFREVDIIVAVLAVMRERELARTNGFDTLDHRLSDRDDDEDRVQRHPARAHPAQRRGRPDRQAQDSSRVRRLAETFSPA